MTEQQDTAGRADLRGKLSPEEVTDSLTGWDEIAIEQGFGITLERMTKLHREIQVMRALGAVILARSEGTKIEAQYKVVMDMGQSEVLALFDAEGDDVMPDDPDSDVGKGGSPQPSGPTGWQPSSS